MSEQKYIRVEEAAERFKVDESVHPLTKMVAELAVATLESGPTYTPSDILAASVVNYKAKKPANSGVYLVYNENEEMWHDARFYEDVGENGEFGWWQAQYTGGGYAGEEFQVCGGIVCWLDCSLPKPSTRRDNL